MLDNKTKERIAQEAEKAFPTNKPKEYSPLTMGERKLGYIAGGEAEATRAAEGIKILKELCELKKYKDTLGKDGFYEKRQPELWKLANEFLTNYNNPVNK